MRFPLIPAALAAVLLVGATAPSLALCLVCNASVRLDPALAACFAERADAELEALASSGESFVIIDLKDCQSRGSLPTAEKADMPVDSEFVADADSIKCLSAEIAALDDTALTPSHLFDLTKACPAP